MLPYKRDAVLYSHPEELIKPVLNSKHTFAIFVFSVCTNYKRRKDIRETWGDTAPYFETAVIFVLGRCNTREDVRTLTEESEFYGDILILDILETYQNLVVKSISLLFWLQRHQWPQLLNIAKVDDDVWLNLKLLTNLTTHKNIYMGGHLQTAVGRLQPIREPEKKFFGPGHQGF